MTDSGYPNQRDRDKSDEGGEKPRDGRCQDQIGYIVRPLAQATLPQTRPESGWRFMRRNGRVAVTLTGQPDPHDPEQPFGLPYGSVPRLLLAWLGSEYKRHGRREIDLGRSQRAFLRAIDMDGRGGPRGGIQRTKWQLTRLMTTAIQTTEAPRTDQGQVLDGGGLFADEMMLEAKTTERYFGALPIIDPSVPSVLWWEPRRPEDVGPYGWIVLSKEFAEILGTAIPIDMRALRDLARSPLAMDFYVWLTSRYVRVTKNVVVPWEYLRMQFGADYGREARRRRREFESGRNLVGQARYDAEREVVLAEQQAARDFRKAAKDALWKVHCVYPGAHFTVLDRGLQLEPSLPHVRRRPSRSDGGRPSQRP